MCGNELSHLSCVETALLRGKQEAVVWDLRKLAAVPPIYFFACLP